MPQTTLVSYFLPTSGQVKPILTSSHLPHVPGTQLQTSQTVQLTNATQISCNTLTSDSKDQAPSLRQSPILATLNNDGLEFFVPLGRPRAAVVKVLASHLTRLKSITATLLPIRYPDKFYNECLSETRTADVSRVLLWDAQPVGWIRCRVEEDDQGRAQIYVQALGILAPYRGSGLATALLDQVTTPAVTQKYSANSIYCHVWESNQDALEWYEKRGFRRVVLIDHYYRRLRPAAAWIMRKDLP